MAMRATKEEKENEIEWKETRGREEKGVVTTTHKNNHDVKKEKKEREENTYIGAATERAWGLIVTR